MSDIAESSSKQHGKRDERTDKQAFTQVEKWMAMVREIGQERQTQRERTGLNAARPRNDRRVPTK